jgi:DNA repair protein RecO (recombination protein O)
LDWSDDAIVLSARKHGETSLITNLLTRDHGRHSGLVRGGANQRNRGLFEPGNLVRVHWRARLSDHLGTFQCELTKAVAADLMENRLKLSGLCSICAVSDVALPEREAHRALYESFLILIDTFPDNFLWPTIYVKWELGLLQELGFGLDFSSCAVTGETKNLAFVSPKSGKAVTINAAAPYKHLLLKLPSFLTQSNKTGTIEDIQQALKLTGYFLNRHAFGTYPGNAPAARNRFIERIKTEATLR